MPHSPRAPSLPAGLLSLALATTTLTAQYAELSQARRLPVLSFTTQHPVAADLDGDGDLDLVAPGAASASGAVIWRNDGQGVFADVTATSLPPGLVQTFAAAAGDLDGDGDVDLVLVAIARDTVFLNDGSGRFTVAAGGPQYTSPGSARLADVDRDGDLDVLGRDANGFPQIRLWRNDGTARFTPDPTSIPQTGALDVAAVLDVENDGDPDIVAIDQTLASLWINDGTGRFTDQPARLNGAPGGSFEPGDVDGDGDSDLAGWSLLLVNDGRGVFTDESARRLPGSVTASQRMPRLGDADADGDLDALFSRYDGMLFCHNDGRGLFADVTATHLVPASGFGLQQLFADFDGDGDADLVAFEPPARFYAGSPTGTLRSEDPRVTPTLFNVRTLDAGDVDGDGDADLAVGRGLTFLPFDGETVLLRNDGLGGFALDRAALPSPSQDTTRVRFVDLDRDGDLDLLEANTVFAFWKGPYGGPEYVYHNLGGGSFRALQLGTVQDSSNGIAAADVDGDGDLDVFVANAPGSRDPGQNRLYRNRGGMLGFDDATAQLPPDTDTTHDILAGDVDGDRDVDLVCVNAGQDRLYLNDGSGRFTDRTGGRLPVESAAPRGGVLHDLDGDGDLDLMLGGRWLYGNDGRGVFQDVSAARMPVTLGDSRDHSPLDVDGDGDIDVVLGGGANLLLLNQAGVFSVAPPARFPLSAGSVGLALGDVDADLDQDVVFTDGRSFTTWPCVERQLHAPGLRRRGQPYALRLFARPGYATAAQKIVPFAGFELAAQPLQLPPWGAFRLPLLPLAQLPALAVPFPAGTISLDVLVPSELDDVPLFLQALVLHAPDPSAWRFSNVLPLRR